MSRFIVPVAIACLLMFLSVVEAEETGRFILTDNRPVAEANNKVVTETAWLLTEPSGQSVGLHRYAVSGEKPVASVLYLPGTNMNGTLKVSDERHNLWLFLAGRGVAVFTLDYRTHALSHDFEDELDFMRDWTTDLFVEDAVTAASMVMEEHPEVPLYVAGFSRGALFAYALTGQVEVAGVIALDGSIKHYREKPFDLAAALQKFDAEAVYSTVLSRRGFRGRDELMRRAVDEPDAPASDDRFDSAAQELAASLQRAWGPGVLANVEDDVSPLAVLATEMRAYDWFYPSIQDIEARSMASVADDPNTYVDDHLGRRSVPVLYFGSSRTGAENLLNGIYSAKLVGGDDVTISVLENYGHLDVLFASKAVSDVYTPILNWLMDDLPSAAD